MTYSEILEKLEAATGPDREIDWMVFEAAHPGAADTEYAPPYTASLDATAELIKSELLGWEWEAKGPNRPLANVWYSGVFLHTAIEKKGATPPLALLTAAIRALADKDAA